MTTSPQELRRLNRELKAKGRRICGGCGRNLPLTNEYWYFSAKGRDRVTLYASSLCRVCARFHTAEAGRKKYKAEKAYREYKARYRRVYFGNIENLERHRARNRETIREKRREEKRRAFERRVKGKA